jgi:hypothetical protein
MNIENKPIWQVAAGDKDRNYVDLMLRWDVIIWGPGCFGPWPDCIVELKNKWPGQLRIGRRFCEDINDGDIITLRLGTNEIYGVGVAVGGVQWLDDFGDIDGWDLQMVRRVRWLWKNLDQPKTFPMNTLKWGDTVRKMDSIDVLLWLNELQVGQMEHDRDIEKLPISCMDKVPIRLIDTIEIGDYLFDKGIGASQIDSLLSQMGELVRIAKWYERTKQDTSKHETVAYLVVPLLRALGWTPQKMAVEWHSVDIALFDRMPRTNDNLVVVVEAKKRGKGCLTAKSQAEYYAEQIGQEKCRRLIVTDGLRYGVYVREHGGKFPVKPMAYLNLTRMVDTYPILECKGAKDALLIMASDWTD